MDDVTDFLKHKKSSKSIQTSSNTMWFFRQQSAAAGTVPTRLREDHPQMIAEFQRTNAAALSCGVPYSPDLLHAQKQHRQRQLQSQQQQPQTQQLVVISQLVARQFFCLIFLKNEFSLMQGRNLHGADGGCRECKNCRSRFRARTWLKTSG